jgi:3-oxoadipate enol-lactonase
MQQRTATERVQVNGYSLHVQVDGPAGAPWLVLAHSLGASLSLWEPQVAHFSQRHRVLRYDARGHGRSSVPPRPYTLTALGSDVLGLLDAFAIERASFCGISMGGATGMWLATHAAQRLDRLVLCNTTPWLGPPEPMNSRIVQVLAKGVEPLVEGILERWFTAEFRALEPAAVEAVRQALLATPAAGYAGCCEALRDMDQRAELPRITTPTLVIAGTYDPAPAIAAAREWAATIPGALFIELPTAHISNVGAAPAFNAAVMNFMQTA